ncbi:MAG: M81 family metallopeptidase [Chloroflexi bacterium]|jgi:microcystin degradation protein MlrC|nr:M81 family metallopeptidase [Chloroflexota bacterium]
MRIAIAGLAHETNTFSTLPTSYEDFRVTRGSALIDAPFWQRLADMGHELFPLFVAHATPSGRVTRACFERFLDDLLTDLQEHLPLDGLLLHLHGAMDVEGVGDGETAILRAVRDIVGRDTFIAVTLDLHANLAQEVVIHSDLLTAYRTAPHRDVLETQERGARLMIACMEAKIRPTSLMIKLPLLLAGESAVTEVEPARSLYARLSQLDSSPGILTASILIGNAWTDSPQTAVSVLLSGTDANVVNREASKLAREIWARRAEFAIDAPTGTMDEAIRMAYAAPEQPVFVSDSGDNITAGATGDSPVFLEHLVNAGVQGALVAGITDPQSLKQCFAAGEGGVVDLFIGGRLDYTFARPYAARATVLRLLHKAQGVTPQALVRVGNVEVVLQPDRQPFTDLRYFEQLGIDVHQKKMIVVKLGYLFPELRDFAPRHIMALSPGFSDLRLDRLPYQHLVRPIYPLDKEAEWRG